MAYSPQIQMQVIIKGIGKGHLVEVKNSFRTNHEGGHSNNTLANQYSFKLRMTKKTATGTSEQCIKGHASVMKQSVLSASGHQARVPR